MTEKNTPSKPASNAASELASNKSKPPLRSTIKRIRNVAIGLVVLLLMAAAAGSYWFGYPFAWPVLGASSEQSMGQRVELMEQQINDSDRELASVNARVEEASQRLDALAGALSAQADQASEQIAKAEAQRGEISDTLERQNRQLSQLQAQDARLQQQLVALEAKLDQSAQQRLEGAQLFELVDASVLQLAKRQSRLVQALALLTDAQRAFVAYETERGLGLYRQAGMLLDDPALELGTLQQAIEQERRALAQWPRIDWVGYQQRIVELSLAVSDGSLALKDVTESAPIVDQVSVDQPQTQGWWGRIKHALGSVVTVRSRDPEAMSSYQQSMLQAGLVQRLLLLETALAARDLGNVRRQASLVRGQMERLFNEDERGLGDALALMAQLEAVEWPEDRPMGQAREMAIGLLESP